MCVEFKIDLSSDSPKQKIEDDCYEYAQFAENIVYCINSYKGKDCLTININGPWGSGKSTVLNFIKQLLCCENAKNRIIFLNPWWFSGREDLLKLFFGQIISCFKNHYAFSSIVRNLQKLSSILTDISQITNLFGIDLKNIAKILRTLNKNKEENLIELKEKISNSLNSISEKVIILIDDVDRLAVKEIQEIFKFINVILDLPNIIYVIAFDEGIVKRALKNEFPDSDKNFIEKIINIKFNLPIIDKRRFYNKFNNELKVIKKTSPNELFNDALFFDIYKYIEYFLIVPRDLERLLNGIKVSYAPVAGEVNIVNLISIETLRLFEPEVYEYIKQNASLFTFRDYCNPYPEDNIDVSSEIEANLKNLIKNFNKGLIFDFVKKIFPCIDKVKLDSTIKFEHKRLLSVCCPEFFYIYFSNTYVKYNIRYKSIKDIVYSNLKYDDFQLVIKTVVEEDENIFLYKLYNLLIRLDCYFNTLKDGNLLKILSYIFNINDIEKLIYNDEFEINETVRIMYNLVKCMDNDDVVKIYNNSNNFNIFQLYLLKFILNERDVLTKAVSYQCEENLKNILICKLKIASCDIRFAQRKFFSKILCLWRLWETDNSVQEWCENFILDDNNLVMFIDKIPSLADEFTNYSNDRYIVLEMSAVEKFLDLKYFKKRLLELNKEYLTGSQVEYIDQLLHQMCSVDVK